MSKNNETDLLKVVVVGHVDHGKSTLIGRLLVDTGKVPEDRVSSVERLCREKGISFEPAFLLDGFEEERDQGITIDTTRVNFEYDGKRFCIIDAPGHAEFLRNMTTAASHADVGVLVIDCQQGPRAQTLQHIRSLAMVGITDVVVVINKMDKVDYSQTEFDASANAVKQTLKDEGLTCVAVVPISAQAGTNIFGSSDMMPWYQGKHLLKVLCELEPRDYTSKDHEQPFRMVLQDIYRFDEEQRYFAGRVVSGQINVGDDVVFSPSAKAARIKEIRQFPGLTLESAVKGDSVALTLTHDIFLERGEIASRPHELPEIETEFCARIVWIGKEAFTPGAEYTLKIGTAESKCTVTIVAADHKPEDAVLHNGLFADVVIKSEHPVAFDTSRFGVVNFVLCSKLETSAAGLVVEKVEAKIQNMSPAKRAVFQETGFVERQEFESLHGHKGGVVWLTGLSGAGKSTLAKLIERRLFAEGCRVVVLDGDNLRHGLCADLGFSAADRSENVRRIAQMSRLLVNTGTIVVVACVSPYKKDREAAREIIGKESFFEVFVFCPLEVCQSRDPKGLYAKSKSGEMGGLSGIGAPYQPPSSPALRINSNEINPEESRDAVMDLLLTHEIIVTDSNKKRSQHGQKDLEPALDLH
jgi:bifunctional enzyme CysN/CysC